MYSVGPDGRDDKLKTVINNVDWQLYGDFCLRFFDSATHTWLPKPLGVSSTTTQTQLQQLWPLT